MQLDCAEFLAAHQALAAHLHVAILQLPLRLATIVTLPGREILAIEQHHRIRRRRTGGARCDNGRFSVAGGSGGKGYECHGGSGDSKQTDCTSFHENR